MEEDCVEMALRTSHGTDVFDRAHMMPAAAGFNWMNYALHELFEVTYIVELVGARAVTSVLVVSS
jgi:hypothetical protein